MIIRFITNIGYRLSIINWLVYLSHDKILKFNIAQNSKFLANNNNIDNNITRD